MSNTGRTIGWVPSDPALALGYATVDGRINESHLISTMDASSNWPAIQTLRAWERDQLALRGGERLLDVGCGPGDGAVAVATDLGSDGEVVGIDRSDEMLRVARRRASAAGCRFQVARGDAMSLCVTDASFDAARSERTLQWVRDPARVVSELHRVVRPGGRVALIDADWSTLRIDIGDERVTAPVRALLQQERRRPSNVGSRLLNLCRDAGFVDVDTTAATHIWTRWDPDATPVPDGFLAIEDLADDLVEAGSFDPHDAGRFVTSIQDAARNDRFFMALTMFAVVGYRVPGVERQ